MGEFWQGYQTAKTQSQEYMKPHTLQLSYRFTSGRMRGVAAKQLSFKFAGRMWVHIKYRVLDLLEIRLSWDKPE